MCVSFGRLFDKAANLLYCIKCLCQKLFVSDTISNCQVKGMPITMSKQTLLVDTFDNSWDTFLAARHCTGPIIALTLSILQSEIHADEHILEKHI